MKAVKETLGICPKCGDKIIERKSRRGKLFYGCNAYPNCDFVSWDAPIKETCPKCGKTLLEKKGKQGKIYCADENCGYVKTVNDDE